MDTNLLTIDNMLFTGATSLKIPSITKPTLSANTTRVSQAPDNTLPHTNTPETITADNISSNPRKEIISKPRDDFNQTLRKTVKAELSQKDQTKIKPDTDDQLAKLIANLKDSKSKPNIEHAHKSVEIIPLVNPNKNQFGIEIIAQDKSEGQRELKNVIKNPVINKNILQTSLLNTSKGISKAVIQPVKSKNYKEISTSKNIVVTKKASTNVENNKKPISQVIFTANDNKTLDNEKVCILDSSVVADNTKSPITGQKADPITIIDDDSKTIKSDKNLMDKSVIHTNEKTSVLNATEKTPAKNTNFSQSQNKITELDSQPIETVPEKSKPNAEITTNNKTTQTEIISETSNNKDKEIPNKANKFLDNSIVRDSNITDVKISINQTKRNDTSTFNNNSHFDSEQTPSQNNPLTSVTELSPNPTEGTKTFEYPSQNLPNNTSVEIGKQVLESIHNSYTQEGRNQQITVQLNPPELGKVLIKFQEQDSQITGLLEVSKTQTRVEIEQLIPQIVRSLQESGIQIKRFDVTLTQGEQSGQGSLKEQTLQNGFAQQQGSADSYTGRNNPNTGEINEWFNNNISYRNISELEKSLIDDGSINMLI
jgi:flagellar hook-length control protein FliK